MTDKGIDRRQILQWSGLAAAGVPLAAPLEDLPPDRSSPPTGIPPETRPGGAYDRYVAGLAAAGQFSGVVLLSHRGRTVLSRAYGWADEEKKIPNREGTAFSLSSAGKPFVAVAVLQLAQQGRLQLTDTVGRHLAGFAADVAGQVTIHHLLSGTSGLNSPAEDVERVFRSTAEVHDYYEQRARQATLTGIPGLPGTGHQEAEITISALLVEAVSGLTFWDYVRRNVYRRCGMTSEPFATRPRWLTDPGIAHPYMRVAGGAVVDALRHLDQGSARPEVLGKNPGRAFVAAPGDGGFAGAPDLVRFGRALLDGTLLERPWADVLLAARIPTGPAAFAAYQIPVSIANGQWQYERAGGNPGVGANWSIYPGTGWVGVILANRDDVPLVDMIDQQTQAITGAPAENGGGGG